MNERPFSLSLLKLLVNVWWWGMIVTAVLAAVWVTIQSSDRLEMSMVGYASDIDTSALMAEDRNGQPLQVQFDGPAKIKFIAGSEDGDAKLHAGKKAILLLVLIPVFAGGILFVKQLKDIVRTIDQHDPFIAENARRLKTMGVLILLFAILKGFGQLAISGFADSMVKPTGFSLNGRVEIPLGLIVVGTAVIVLAEVFRHGTRMREEQSLTI